MLPPTCLSLRGGLERLFVEKDPSVERGEQVPGRTRSSDVLEPDNGRSDCGQGREHHHQSSDFRSSVSLELFDERRIGQAPRIGRDRTIRAARRAGARTEPNAPANPSPPRAIPPLRLRLQFRGPSHPKRLHIGRFANRRLIAGRAVSRALLLPTLFRAKSSIARSPLRAHLRTLRNRIDRHCSRSS